MIRVEHRTAERRPMPLKKLAVGAPTKPESHKSVDWFLGQEPVKQKIARAVAEAAYQDLADDAVALRIAEEAARAAAEAERARVGAERAIRNPTAPPLDRAFSVNEAATYLGLSVAYLNRRRTQGGGPPYFKISTRVVYRRADLDEWLESHRRKSTSDYGASQ